MKSYLRAIIKTVLCIVALFISYWFMLPPLNFRSPDFYGFLVFAFVLCAAIIAFSDIICFIKERVEGRTDKSRFSTRIRRFSLPAKITLGALALTVVVLIVGAIIGSQFFNASRYNKLLTMTDGSFTDDVSEISKDQIPVVDRDTASRLGLRKLGEMSDLVSQFEILEDYTQINYAGRPVRVTPLAYGDIIKWFNNQNEGIPAYISVDMTTQEASLVRLDEGIKYSESEYFMRNLARRLRFSYPTKIFDDISFEIDENGVPYYVASTATYRIGLFDGMDISGAVLLNAVTGESVYYPVDEIPSWVDRVYNADLIVNQLNYNGKYRSGYWNSVFGQKGVLQTTSGYNYLAINDDVFLYTGITSVGKDESNVGFVLVNMRTKETKYYAIPGAEEYSAMSSAEGQVQHLSYTATFPLLLNVADRPSYFVSLKDAAGLVKMYAFVDVQQYQIVGIGNTVDLARTDYLSKLSETGNVSDSVASETLTAQISRIGSAVIEGNTTFYLRLSDGNNFTVTAAAAPDLVFAAVGDTVTVDFSEADGVKTANTVILN